MSFLDKAKKLAEKAAPLIDKAAPHAQNAVDKAGQQIDKRTGGKYRSKIEAVEAKVGELADRRIAGSRARDASATGGGVAAEPVAGDPAGAATGGFPPQPPVAAVPEAPAPAAPGVPPPAVPEAPTFFPAGSAPADSAGLQTDADAYPTAPASPAETSADAYRSDPAVPAAKPVPPAVPAAKPVPPADEASGPPFPGGSTGPAAPPGS